MRDTRPIPPHRDIASLHYQLDCYVGKGGAVSPATLDPAVNQLATFDVIFSNRPNDCRFAIARKMPLSIDEDQTPGPWLVWDFFDTDLVAGRRLGPTGNTPPPPLWRGPVSDALLIKCMVFYE